jgi:sugar lactone lactonase YvrE
MKRTDMNNEIALKLALAMAVIVSLAGCGATNSSSGNGTGGGTTTPTAAKSIYVIQNSQTFPVTPGSVLQLSTATSGNISPEKTIIAPAGNDFQGLATDAKGNLYVAANSQTTSMLLEYAPGANGTATPIGSIPSNTTTMMSAPDGLAISPSGQIVVGEDGGAVATYSADASGTVAPEYYIAGNLTKLNAAESVAASSSGIYVFNPGNLNGPPILIFSPTATGNVAPIGSLGGSLTGITGFIGGIATDSSGNFYVTNTDINAGSVLVFAPTATGNVAPARTIAGTSTELGALGGIQVDAVGNIYVISTSGHGENPTVLEFAASASGNAAPTLTITSSAWTFPDNYISLAVY